MNKHPLAEEYLHWLEPQTREEHGYPDQSYWDLLHIMFDKEFVWLVPYDDNRAADGRDLRIEFCYSHHFRPDALRNLGPCSFLEVLVALSRRVSFEAGGSARGWAWKLMDNLRLLNMWDPLPRRKAAEVDDILETCIRRTYGPDGVGGFFPLSWPQEDQREVELWYQMAAYIDELHPEHHG